MDACPAGCNLQGQAIPEQYRDMYGEGVTHYSRAIGRYDMHLDRTVEWLCPDCGISWPR